MRRLRQIANQCDMQQLAILEYIVRDAELPVFVSDDYLVVAELLIG